MSGHQLELFPTAEYPAPEPPPRPALSASDSLEAAIAPFTEYMQQKEFAENTIKSFLGDLRLLISFAGPKTPLADCSAHKLRAFTEYLQHGRGVPCSAKSLDRRITTLKVFFGWLAESGILETDPAAALVHRGATSPLPRILSDAQVEALLAVTRSMRDAEEAPDARPHLLVTLLLSTGIKKAECMRIGLDHIDYGNPERPILYVHYERPRQRFKARRLALPSDWSPTMQLYLQRYQPRERLFECTPRNLEYVLHNLSVVAGLPEPLTFEMLRWTSATRCYRAGMDPERLRKRLGLSRISWRETSATLQALADEPL
ncbi:MAG TPA: site-specific integrase [Chloroflexi bacterium]|nr:site-specific integrase [Chloroflexota bacterium]